MLRTSYLGKFRTKSQSVVNEIDLKALLEDDNYLIKSSRPIKEHEIMGIVSEDLEKFVDSVLTDNKLNNILYSSNAKSETNFVRKTSKSLNSKVRKKHNMADEKSPQIIVFNRMKNEAISKIVVESKDYKEKKKDKLDYLTGKIYSFYNGIQVDKMQTAKKNADYTMEYRKKRFLEIFDSIKMKVKENGLVLPAVQLDTKNVYSRLFHNVVYLEKNNKEEQCDKKVKRRSGSMVMNSFKKESVNRFNNPPPPLNVKSVLQDNYGKEFTLKITNKEYTKCFTRHSGGPTAKSSLEDTLLGKDSSLTYIIGMKDPKGNSFLHVSVLENVPSLVYYFILKGLDPNLQNFDGDTALHLAIKTENKNIILLLLDNGAEVDILNHKKETPVDAASNDIRKIFYLDNLFNETTLKKNR